MCEKSNKYDTLDIEISIIFGLYGTDLTIQQIKEYLFAEFDTDYSAEEIEDYLVVKAREDLKKVNTEYTIEWSDLIR